jgi:leucyl aminopeptidase
MTLVTFEKSKEPLGTILQISNETIVVSISETSPTVKDMIYLMSFVIFNKMYTQPVIKIKLIEDLEEKVLETQIRAFCLFTYKQLSFRTESDDKVKFELVHTSKPRTLKLIETNTVICSYLNEIKDLIEMPPEQIYPETLLKYIIKFSKKNHLKIVDVYDERRLEKEGFGGILSVGKGSHNPPKMAVLEWPGSGKSNAKPVVLVGKGITYDSGGYSVKTGDYMKDMKRDKTGVCIILGIMGALAKLRYPHRVVAILPMAENVISSKSYKPDEIIKSYSKKTVEIFNTDAEGRVLLMDGLALATKFNPRLIIDVATLTGVGIFCGQFGALFTNNTKTAWDVQEAGERVGDRFWVLPIVDEYIEDSRGSKLANVKNDGFNCYSTTTMGATFLRNFVSDKVPWVHVDLGSSNSMYEKHNIKNSNSTNSFLMIMEYLLNSNFSKKLS